MQTNRRDALKWMGASAVALSPLAHAVAQQGWQPRQAVEYIAPANPGGGWDTLIRTTARVIGEANLAPVNFAPVNIPGGGGAVAWAQIAAKRGNPHVLFAASPPIILVPMAGQTPLTHKNFTPIARLITDYSIILVRTNAPYKTAKELFDAIKARPNLSVGGGSGPQRMSSMPDVPTLQEQGINFTFDIWRGIMGAPNMPAEAVAYYQNMYERMLKSTAWAAARDQLGWIDAFQSSQQFGAFLDGQQKQFSTVLSDLGLARS
jgi:tripartite-type tricarboxylate transporter receptor subunit TctC